MRIIEKHEAFEEWKLEVICKDSGWRKEHNNCGSKLEADKNDIYCREAYKYPDDNWMTYGIICPVCGSYVEIDKDKIPLGIRQSAKLYSEYKAKKEEDKDIDPCIKNGCNFSKRQTCCGCRERIEWEKRRKNGNSNKNGTN